MKLLISIIVLTGMPAILESGQPTGTVVGHNTVNNRNKRSPLDIGQNSRKQNSRTSSKTRSNSGYSFSDASNTNNNSSGSGSIWTGNPEEYTIGGVLSGSSGIEHYFTQVLSVSDKFLYIYLLFS